jgi:hypothetical protein
MGTDLDHVATQALWKARLGHDRAEDRRVEDIPHHVRHAAAEQIVTLALLVIVSVCRGAR